MKKEVSKKKNIVKELGVFNKKNIISKYISKYLGWKPIDRNSHLEKIAKQIYKVDRDYLFYSR